MYGENGAAMRNELAALLRVHRVQQPLGQPTRAHRELHGQQILQYRQSLLVWCAQALRVSSPFLFSRTQTRATDPFRPTCSAATAAGELARTLDQAATQSSAPIASSELLTSPSHNPIVEHWRQAARAAALAEHDTAGEIAKRLTAPQAQALAGDVASITQALVVLDERYHNTPGWQHIPNGARLGWAALATALDVGLGQPDYTIDTLGWRPRTKPIGGPVRPGILGVLQAEHDLLVRLKVFPSLVNVRLVVDSQRLLSAKLAPLARRVDQGLAGRWEARGATYALIQRQLRDLGGQIGKGALAAAEGANALSRLEKVPTEAIVEPRVLAGFAALFDKIDDRIADTLEAGIRRGAYLQRVTVPRLVKGSGQAVQPVRERYAVATGATDIEVIHTVRNDLRPRRSLEAPGPGATRAELAVALIHRPGPRPSRAIADGRSLSGGD